MLARNESWVIGASLRAALMYCDLVIVLLHACTDATAAIVQAVSMEHKGRVLTLTSDDSVLWSEMEHRQRTLAEGRKLGCTHFAVIDADEILCGDTLPHVRSAIGELNPGLFLGIPMRNLHRSLDQYRSDGGIWGTRAGTMLAFADSLQSHWRAEGGYDHHHRHPYGTRAGARLEAGGGLMHLQFASWRRLVAKHEWYRMMERIKYPAKPVADIDRMYSLSQDERGAQTLPTPAGWWEPYAHLQQYIDTDAQPWHEAECERLLAEHGAAFFAGLTISQTLQRAA